MNRIIWPLFLQALGQWLTGLLREEAGLCMVVGAVFLVLTLTGYVLKLK